MPLAVENFVQENSGFTTTAATSVNVTLPSGTTAGNTLVVVIAHPTSQASPPADFALAKSQGSNVSVFTRSEVPASETSWTFTTVGTIKFAWYVAELSNVDSVLPLDASAGFTFTPPVGNGGTCTSGTTGATVGLSTVAFAAWATQEGVADAHSWSGYTNEFEEVADVGGGTSGGAHLAVARAFKNEQVGTYESTATFANSGVDSEGNSLVIALREADTAIAATLTKIFGFEWGTHGGIGNTGATALSGSAINPVVGTWGTNVLIQAGSARNSTYGLRITQSGAAAAWVVTGFGSTAQGAAWGFNVRVVSATGTVVIAELNNGGVDNLRLVYNASTTKFGLQWGTGGTVAYESGTTALNTWRWVDLRGKFNTSVFHAEWRIETGVDTYTDQTSPADLTGQTGGVSFDSMFLGGNAAQTMTADYDDVILCPYYAAYPLGPHEIRLLVPEATGASVSGTATNFSKFTANGTLAAWASDAGALLDEVPPTVSASSDGVVQTATAASDYMQFPMQTYTLAANEAIAAVRFYASEWGGAGAGTGTIGYRGHDGTTETTFIAASSSYDAASPTAYSATEPLWKTAMWPQIPNWRQSQLDAAVLRVGFSTDAAPDMGVSAIYLEVAIRKTQLETLFGEPGGLYVKANRDPVTNALASFTVETPAGLGATVNYEIDGTPQTPIVVAAASSYTQQLNAIAFSEINRLELIPG